MRWVALGLLIAVVAPRDAAAIRYEKSARLATVAGTLKRMVKALPRLTITKKIAGALVPRRPAPREYFGYVGEEHREFYHPRTGAFVYRPAKPRTLPLDNGDAPLHFVRLNFGTTEGNAAYFPEVLADYVHAMQRVPDFKVRVLLNDEDQPALEKLIAHVPAALRSRIVPVPIGRKNMIRAWSRDASMILGDRKTVLLPRERMSGGELDEEREENPQGFADYFGIVEKYAAATKLKVVRSPFRFEGGNILAGARHVFAGADIVENAMRDYEITQTEALAALSAEFGKKVVSIGKVTPFGSEQPRQHVDLAMAIVRDKKSGKEVALVESSRLARQLLGHAQVTALQGEYAPFAAGDEKLDETAAHLESLGYRVVRVPGFQTNWAASINYANVVLTHEHALVPKMGVEKLDEYAAGVYRELGYEVIPMASAQRSFKYNGGPRCLGETCR